MSATYLLVICNEQVSICSRRESIGLAVPLCSNCDILCRVNLQYPAKGNIDNIKVAKGISDWAFQEDVLEVASEASTPLSLLANASYLIWDPQVQLRLDYRRRGVEVHSGCVFCGMLCCCVCIVE